GRAAAGNGFTHQRERIQLVTREGLVEQRIGGDQRRHARRRRPAQARTQRDALVQDQFEAVADPVAFTQFDERAPGGVEFGRGRQEAGTLGVALDRGNAHAGRVDATDRRAVAGAADGVAEQVEAYPDVADAGRREG